MTEADKLVDKIEDLERQLMEKDKQLFEENLQVKRLEAQLAEASKEETKLCAKVITLNAQIANAATANLAIRSERDQAVAQLHCELAEARAEIERLHERLQANGAKIDDEDVVIEITAILRLYADKMEAE